MTNNIILYDWIVREENQGNAIGVDKRSKGQGCETSSF